MRNSKWRWMLTAVVFAVSGAGISIGAANIATEKAVAGINLSLDKYTDVMLAEQNAENDEELKESKEKASTKSEGASEDEEDTSHFKLNLVYDRLGVAKVDSYLNVRSKPSESGKIVGKMTKNSGCHIYKVKKGWAKMISGGVKGWVKADYLVMDQEAEELARKVANLRISVTTETLNVRYLPTTDARVYDQISQESEYDIVKRNLTKEWIEDYMSTHCKKSELKEIDKEDMFNNLDDWICIRIDREKAFVSKDFVKVTYNLDRAVSIKSKNGGGSGNSSGGGSSILSQIVNYAMNYLGNRYVYGGTSLTNGTDCSGFTMRIYQHFGYSIPRTSASQAASLPSVSSSNVRPGDLFFYGSGGVSHVGMYIGNNQIIHASNERTGIKISYAYYRTPIKIGRVIR